ncbi:hypothetical protein [Streptomyces anulatus]|uniref:hypothetical protein n=1 Tax=Streptomyces anulatus TaxID=1892 RepID=UPI003442EF0B
MRRHLFRRCGNAPGSITPEDQAVIDAFRAHLAAIAALRTPEPWTPGQGQNIAVRVGPRIERAHPRPSDDHGTEAIAGRLAQDTEQTFSSGGCAAT